MRDGSCTVKLNASAVAIVFGSFDNSAKRKSQAEARNTPGTNFCQAAQVAPLSWLSAISIQPSIYWVEAEPSTSGSARTSATERIFCPTGTPTICVEPLTDACTTDPALMMWLAGIV